MLIFSYGSNMCFNRIRQRVPSTRFVATGFLEGHVMRCHKRSVDGSGKGTILKSNNGDIVWGVIFDIEPKEKHLLDKVEGLGKGYNEAHIDVKNNERSYRTQVYIADEDFLDPGARTYNWYKDFIVTGAIEHGLPQKYIEYLKQIPATEDKDQARAILNRNILDGAF